MTRPYTPRQLARQPCLCAGCSQPSAHQWLACADGSYRTLCDKHDADLNEIILRFFGLPDAEAQIERYRGEMRGDRT